MQTICSHVVLQHLCRVANESAVNEAEYALNFTIQPIFVKSIGSLKLGKPPKFSTEFEFGVMKSRYWASQTPNLSWEIAFFMQFLVPTSHFYTVVFKMLNIF